LVLILSARFIVLEGIDQSGKTTQAKLLVARLSQEGFRVGVLSFPVYDSGSGKLIEEYLAEKNRMPFRAICVLYSLNRWESVDKINILLKDNDFVVASRYTGSSLAYGMAGGLDYEWLANLDKGLPSPDVVLFLNIPLRTSLTRKTEGRDAHERQKEYLERVRRNYLDLARKHSWRLVRGSGSVESVQQRVWTSVQDLAQRINKLT
jgi:dTMP kinase